LAVSEKVLILQKICHLTVNQSINLLTFVRQCDRTEGTLNTAQSTGQTGIAKRGKNVNGH